MSTSYSNLGGTGYRLYSLIGVSTTGFTFSGTLGGAFELINGTFTNTTYFPAFAIDSSKSINFDFFYPAIIDEAKWYQSTTTAEGVWKWQGSNNGSDWTDIGSPFTLGGVATQTQTELNGNTTPYRYYRLLGVSGNTSNTPYIREIEFQITYNANGVTPAYGNAGSVGDRTAIITTTSTVTKNAGGSWSDLINGVHANTLYFSAQAVSGKYIKFDFGAGASKIITEAWWYQGAATTHGVWKWQGSNNDSDWVDIGNSFTLGGIAQNQTELNGNTTGYRYYRLLGVSGNASSTPYIQEIDFKIGDFGWTGTGTATQSPVTAAASGWAQITGTGIITRSPATAAGAGAHGVAGAASVTKSVAIASALGSFGTPRIRFGSGLRFGAGYKFGQLLVISGIAAITRSIEVAAASGGHGVSGAGAVTGSAAIASAAGAHGVSGTGQASENPVTASALGSQVAGQGHAVESPEQAAGVGAHGVSGQGTAVRLPAFAAADGYALVSGVGNVNELPSRAIVLMTFGFIGESLRIRGQKFFGSLPSTDLRKQALMWIEAEEVIDQELREKALRWIKEEIKKAA